MPHLCTRCGIVWARLWTMEEGEEDYDVCPECGVDNHLQLSDDTETFVKSRLTGKVVNVRTRKEKEGPLLEPPADPPYYKYRKRKFLTIPRRSI